MRLVRDNGLTIALLALFTVSLIGQVVAGHWVANKDLVEHGARGMGLAAYLTDAHFLGALFENWESEFLQMSAYVVLTAFLVQRGSAESRDPDEVARDEQDDPSRLSARSPAMLRKGAAKRWIYAHSLGLALFVLFVGSFVAHWLFSAREAASEAIRHGERGVGPLAYLADPQLWFESFQNWQSEFLSTAVLVVLSISLRQKGSPESKAVGAAHSDTGT